METKTSENLQVAATILQQLGGQRFIAMTGAKYLLSMQRGLAFAIPSTKPLGINKVTISLSDSDLYTLNFYKIRRNAVTQLVERREDIYAEDLQKVFTQVTGLDTHL